MRRLQSIPALLLFATLLGTYANWSAPRSTGHYLADLRSMLVHEENTAEIKANLLIIRPELFPSDYRSPKHLRLKLAATLDRARGRRLLNEHTVVVLPDQIGTWLLLGGERSEFYSARSLSEAQAWLILDNPHRLAWTWLQSEGFPGMGETLLRMKAERTASDYQQLFSSLAREYRITLLAGSLLLPEPHAENGKLHTGKGHLYHVAPVFGPDGNLLGPLYVQACPTKADVPATLQEVHTDRMKLLVRRRGCQTPSVIEEASMQTGVELALRGRLWPLEDLTHCCGVATAAQGKATSGTQLLNIPIALTPFAALPTKEQ